MKLKRICVLLVALLGALSLCACQEKTNQDNVQGGEPNQEIVQGGGEPNQDKEDENNKDIVLDASVIEEITAAYEKLHNRELRASFDCYGVFGQSYVLIFHGGDTAITHETVDGVTYGFTVVESFDVYCEGELYTLQEAFDNGL